MGMRKGRRAWGVAIAVIAVAYFLLSIILLRKQET